MVGSSSEGIPAVCRCMASVLIRSHRDLVVWQVAMEVRRDVRAILQSLSPQDRFDIGAQVARAALSIPCNISEGHGRQGRKDYKQFLSFARGSAGELDTQLRVIAQDYPELALRIDTILARLDEVSRMLTAIIRKL